jgi:hypothetical protein
VYWVWGSYAFGLERKLQPGDLIREYYARGIMDSETARLANLGELYPKSFDIK